MESITEKSTIPAGPSEFLSLIKDADMVMTDSFHGTIFFHHIPTSVLLRFNVSTIKKIIIKNLRIINLLNMAGVANRFINEERVKDINALKDVNFEDINQKAYPFY
mgnify:CR=1 FL=1